MLFTHQKRKSAFSLIELLIVILIIGVVYTLSISNFTKIQENKELLSLGNLKKYLAQFEYEKEVRLLCLDRCRTCDIYIDGEKSDALSNQESFLNDSVKVFTYQYSQGATREQKKVFFNEEGVEEDICFSYSLNKNKVGQQYLVEFEGSVYDLSTYISPTQKYASLDIAVDAKDKEIQKVFR